MPSVVSIKLHSYFCKIASFCNYHKSIVILYNKTRNTIVTKHDLKYNGFGEKERKMDFGGKNGGNNLSELS